MLGWKIGFRKGIYIDSSGCTGEGCADFSGPHYLYLVLNDFNNNVENNFYCSFAHSIMSKNILARITVPVGSFQLIAQNNLNLITFPRQYYGPVDIQKIQVQLLDEYGRVVHLNHMDYSFCMTMQRVYDL